MMLIPEEALASLGLSKGSTIEELNIKIANNPELAQLVLDGQNIMNSFLPPPPPGVAPPPRPTFSMPPGAPYPFRIPDGVPVNPSAYAFSAPLPSVHLKSLKQPLFDTEVLPAYSPPSELRFFQRQLGQLTEYGDVRKTLHLTNVQQPGQLANPLEFSLYGFQLHIWTPSGSVSAEDREKILANSLFQFMYCGNRIYLSVPGWSIPTNGMPAVQPIEKVPFPQIPEPVSSDPKVEEKRQKDFDKIMSDFAKETYDLKKENKLYLYVVDSAVLRIRPTESFQVALEWKQPPALGHPVFITCVMHGLTWSPL